MYRDATWVSAYRTDPFEVPTADKASLLAEYSARLLAADGVDHVTASVICVKEQTFYADTFGSSITQQRVRVEPHVDATAVDTAAGKFETMTTLAPPTARGWETLTDDDVGLDHRADDPAGLLAEKVNSPSVVAGPTIW